MSYVYVPTITFPGDSSDQLFTGPESESLNIPISNTNLALSLGTTSDLVTKDMYTSLDQTPQPVTQGMYIFFIL